MRPGSLGLVIALVPSLLAAPLAAEAQQPPKVPQIGMLRAGLPPDALVDAFRQGLRELGWIEGQNIAIVYRWAEGGEERLPDLAAELARSKVDVIVVAGRPATRAAKAATGTIPIVMAVSGDPVGDGVVASLARPGGNITGLSALSAELNTKRLELLHQTVPKAYRVAALWDPAAEIPGLQDLQVVARNLGLSLQVEKARGPAELEGAFAAMSKGKARALMVFESAIYTNHRKLIVDFVAKRRLPAIYGTKEYVDVGGLMAYGPSLPDLFRRAATYVDKILKGAKPGDLPVEQPTRFELVINLKTAKALPVTIPQSVLIRADQMIE